MASIIDSFEKLSRHTFNVAEYTSFALFILTGLLLLLTYSLARDRWIEVSAWAALATATLAIQFMLLGWHVAAEPEHGDWPGIVERRADGAGHQFKECPKCPEMVVVQPGYFVMGAADAGAGPEEAPLRTMMIAKRFAIARQATTNAEFRAFAADTGRSMTACAAGAGAAPVQCVSWQDAQAFVAWLKRETGMTYRLASSAEWEYAGRAGSGPPMARPNGGVIQASLQAPSPSASNGFGLSGMGAGRGEWVEDCWSPTLAELAGNGRALQGSIAGNCAARVVKGGGFPGSAGPRLSGRRPIAPAAEIHGIGFRVVREMPRLQQ